VYAGVGVLPDGAELPGAISIGTKPTFGEHARAVEAFLLTSEPGRPRPGADHGWTPLRDLPEYGWRLRLRFGAWVRDMVKFDSLSELLTQMTRDCERVQEWSAGRGSGAREGTEEAACR
jgi:riboflavin kinase/FMN adenylyltransferase